jgi:hypothetical protein|nr:MAG TPA: Flagellar hook-length control protein FliK [Caudoviricetes sp.]
MGFTTAAFIRRNTPELRKKLEELGYRLYGAELNEDLCIFTEPEYGLYSVEFFSNIPHPDETDSVDCGTNEELFLAIAALRDDTSANQWFVADSPLSVSYDDTVGNDHYFTEPKGSVFFWDENWNHATIISGNYHKATVEELIEHFKEKEK